MSLICSLWNIYIYRYFKQAPENIVLGWMIGDLPVISLCQKPIGWSIQLLKPSILLAFMANPPHFLPPFLITAFNYLHFSLRINIGITKYLEICTTNHTILLGLDDLIKNIPSFGHRRHLFFEKIQKSLGT